MVFYFLKIIDEAEEFFDGRKFEVFFFFLFFEHLNIVSIGDSMISIVIRFNKLIRKKFSN